MSEQWSVDGPRVIEVGGPDEVPQHVGVRLLSVRSTSWPTTTWTRSPSR